MGLFRPYERPEDAGATPESAESGSNAVKKRVPTPTRREAEAARRERFHPTLTPAQQRARDRGAKTKSREEQWSKVDNEPSRLLLRDFIDSRPGIAQWWMPIIMSALVLALAAMYAVPDLAVPATFVPYLALAALGVHIFLLWRQFRVLLDERMPGAPKRGLLVYLINRIISMRRFRVPLPRVKPGEEI